VPEVKAIDENAKELEEIYHSLWEAPKRNRPEGKPETPSIEAEVRATG
jgi:hypothetical protein